MAKSLSLDCVLINLTCPSQILITESVVPFEQDALRTFLLRRLDRLGKDDATQKTMISTWIVELYLDKVNTDCLQNCL